MEFPATYKESHDIQSWLLCLSRSTVSCYNAARTAAFQLLEENGQPGGQLLLSCPILLKPLAEMG